MQRELADGAWARDLHKWVIEVPDLKIDNIALFIQNHLVRGDKIMWHACIFITLTDRLASHSPIREQIPWGTGPAGVRVRAYDIIGIGTPAEALMMI